MQALNSRLVPSEAAPVRAAGRARQWHARAGLRDILPPLDDLPPMRLLKPKRLKGKELAIRIYHPKHHINWERWEIRMLELLEKMEQEQAEKDEGAEEEEEEEEPLPGDGEASIWGAHFSQYDNPAVHQARLSDSIYMGAWASAMKALGPNHIKGKVVLNVGCGPGVMALMCAQAGAKKVIAVDGSAAMVEVTKQVAAVNGFGSVIDAAFVRVEDIRLKDKVDVVVADWAGPGLLSGGMLRAVAHARRDLLKPGGLVLPSQADLFITGLEDRSALAEAKKGWESVAGFDLTPVMSQVVQTPRVAPVARASQLCTSTGLIAHWDLGPEGRVTPAAVRRGVSAPFRLECLRDERLFGLVLHFDLGWGLATTATEGAEVGSTASSAAVETAAVDKSVAVKFTTDPRAPPTCFQQVTLNFPRSIRVTKGDVLEGTVEIRPSGPVGADLDIQLKASVNMSNTITV